MPKQEGDNKPKTLGLDDVQANALFAWQHRLLGLFNCDHSEDYNLLVALESVWRKAKKVGMTREELKQVPIDPAWIDEGLLEQAKLKLH